MLSPYVTNCFPDTFNINVIYELIILTTEFPKLLAYAMFHIYYGDIQFLRRVHKRSFEIIGLTGKIGNLTGENIELSNSHICHSKFSCCSW